MVLPVTEDGWPVESGNRSIQLPPLLWRYGALGARPRRSLELDRFHGSGELSLRWHSWNTDLLSDQTRDRASPEIAATHGLEVILEWGHPAGLEMGKSPEAVQDLRSWIARAGGGPFPYFALLLAIRLSAAKNQWKFKQTDWFPCCRNYAGKQWTSGSPSPSRIMRILPRRTEETDRNDR